MIIGDYTLDLYCDHRGEDQQALCFRSDGFVRKTREESLAAAQRRGWLLALSTEKCYCPDHAQEHRGIPTLPNPNCKACEKGDVFMNADPPFEGYTSERTNEVDWPAWNAQGHHHIVWNGDSNELVECGSERCNELAK